MRFSEYVTDAALEEQGVWMRLRKGDAEVLVARAGNKQHEELVRRLRRKHGQGRRGDDLPKEVEEAIALEALSRTILLGWKDFEDDDGKEIEYSAEKARELLKLSRDFRIEVTEIATEMEVYKREETESGKGRSKK